MAIKTTPAIISRSRVMAWAVPGTASSRSGTLSCRKRWARGLVRDRKGSVQWPPRQVISHRFTSPRKVFRLCSDL
jgi:hypothetical protein